MASVLDAVLETTKVLSPTPSKKIAEATKEQTDAEVGQAEAEAGQAEARTGQTEAEAGPSMPSETKAVTSEVQADLQTSDTILTAVRDMVERVKSPASEAPTEAADYIYRHASGKNCPKMKSRKQGIMLKN
jgi:hypothetical protein